MKNTELIRKIKEYLLGTETLKDCEEKESLYPNRSSELRGIRNDIISTKFISNALSLTGLLTPLTPYLTDSSNPEPCKGWAVLIGICTVAYGEMIRNVFDFKIREESRRYERNETCLESALEEN